MGCRSARRWGTWVCLLAIVMACVVAAGVAGGAPAGDVEIIAAVPHLDIKQVGVSRPRWVDVAAALPELRRVGVDTIFIWAPYAHRFPDKGETIPVRTERGIKRLALGACVHILDYLTPDPGRGTPDEFKAMVRRAHSLGIRVIAQLQVSLTAPGDFVYEHHPDWIVQSIYGAPAVKWPWETSRPGYLVNKSHPGLIKFVIEEVLPVWIKELGLDGVYLDSPGMAYCDEEIARLCRRLGAVAGAEPWTPVADKSLSPEPLVRAMRQRIDELAKEVGRPLSFPAELAFTTWQQAPRRCIEDAIRGKFFTWLVDPQADRSLGRYFDWVMSYTYRTVLNDALHGGRMSFSPAYANFFAYEARLDRRYTQVARFINTWVEGHKYIDLLQAPLAAAAISLLCTAPGRIIFVGAYQLPPQDDVIGDKVLGWWDGRKTWLARLIELKKRLPALQSDQIENALLEPSGVKGLWAFNRWDGSQAATVVVNATDAAHLCNLRTRFGGKTVRVRDLVSGQMFEGPPSRLAVSVPPRQTLVLVLAG